MSYSFNVDYGGLVFTVGSIALKANKKEFQSVVKQKSRQVHSYLNQFRDAFVGVMMEFKNLCLTWKDDDASRMHNVEWLCLCITF